MPSFSSFQVTKEGKCIIGLFLGDLVFCWLACMQKNAEKVACFVRKLFCVPMKNDLNFFLSLFLADAKFLYFGKKRMRIKCIFKMLS